MKLVKQQKENEFANLVVSTVKQPSNNFSRFSETNRESFRELISYFAKIKKKDIINEKQYSELVILACANFIENEVEVKVSKSINDRIMYFFEKF